MKTAAIAVALTASSAFGVAQSNYFVGNSLTYNEVFFYVGDKIEMFAQRRGNSHTAGFHWLGGSSLSGIVNSWENSQVYSSASPSDYLTRLPQGGLDNLVLQPSINSANAELNALNRLANLLPSNDPTKLYVYATWPSREKDYLPTWNAPYTNPAVVPDWSPSSAYFSHIVNQFRASQPARDVYMIPAGEVLAEVQRRVDAGTLTGLTSADDLYHDNLHMDFDGMYLIGLTMYATLFKDDPRGIGIPAMFTQYVTPALATQLENLVYDVVWANPGLTLTKPGDANIDSVINFDDLLTLAQNYNATGATWQQGDFNGSGTVDFDDLLILAQGYGTSAATDTAAFSADFRSDWARAQSLVPEPASLALLGATLLTRRRRAH